jgi:threonine dehydratase
MLTLQDVQAAQTRIAGYVRRTPLIQATAMKTPPPGLDSLYLKIESLQVTGSFKPRGAVNTIKTLALADLERGIITASGGNHGLAVAYAGWLANTPATIYLPHNTPPAKAEKLRSWGAKVVMEGAVWDEANQVALALAEETGLTYIHPFANPTVIAGQGTIALEILDDLPQVDVLLVAIGGGGLISGISLAAKARKPSLRVIGIEPTGAPTLYQSRLASQLITLPELTTAATTLAPRRSAEITFEIIEANVDHLLLVDDAAMRQAAQWLWFEFGIAAELSGAAAIAALFSGQVEIDPGETVCALICGAGTDGVPS